MKIQPLIIFLVVLLLTACVHSDDNILDTSLEVEIGTNTKEVSIWEPVIIWATVKKGNTPVIEVEDIQFEIVKKGGVSIGVVNPENVGDGKYQIETMFDEVGIYQIISHVTVDGQHKMPNYEITIVQ